MMTAKSISARCTSRARAQNYIFAHMWFNLAAAQGDAGALANRNHLARMMTPAQIAEAQQLARQWSPS
jgi:uncharacterized protein